MRAAEGSPRPTRFQRLSLDIRFWVALAFFVRLIGIANPPLETSHHWRQTSVLMVARNYAEQGLDLLHPRMDTAGELSGITGMEFPLLNALVGLAMMVFGTATWPARLIVLLMGSLGVLRFHALVERRLGRRTGLYAALLLLVSLWFMYSRKVMPDVFALSLVIIGLERFDRALSASRWWIIVSLVGAVCLAAGLLSKISAGCLLAVWPVLAWRQRTEGRTWAMTAFIALATIPAVWWYHGWVPHLVEAYGYWHFFMGKPIAVGAMELLRNWPRTLDNFYFDALRFSGFAVFLLGLFYAMERRAYGIIIAFLLLCASFLVVMLKAGDTFWIHAYYVLPFVPVMALLGGYGLAQLPGRRWATGLLVAVAFEGVAAQANDFRINPTLEPLLELEGDLIDDEGRIAMNTGQVPTAMYFAHRRGWTLTNAELQDAAILARLEHLGCSRVVVFRSTFEGDVTVPWPLLLEKTAYRIHKAPD
ncbi:MAG: glycosyltransferase family 39 protein, partial [Flavobacteriales bacterium]|nr:glycosyltransferase family 39 protein [Flavobacteriales bacterium]